MSQTTRRTQGSNRSGRASRRILGIDPGLARTGWGVISDDGGRTKVLEYGCVTTPANTAPAKRLVAIHRAFVELLKRTRPDLVAIERIFFGKNVKTAFAVGQARGVILLACGEANRQTVEFAPHEVKLALTGYGKADKLQVQRMVQSRLQLKALPKPDDAADAIAVAVCAAQTKRSL